MSGPAEVDRSAIPTLVDLLVAAGLAASKGEARRTVAEGGAYVNNVRVKRVNMYASSTQLRQVVSIGSYSTRAARTIKVVVVGGKDGRSRGYNVAIDAIRVTF